MTQGLLYLYLGTLGNIFWRLDLSLKDDSIAEKPKMRSRCFDFIIFNNPLTYYLERVMVCLIFFWGTIRYVFFKERY